MLNLFNKSAARTLREAGDAVARGWSPDLPVVLDEKGNITHRCAGTAMASVHRGNRRAWGFLQNVMGGLAPTVNKLPGMTQARMVGYFRRAEAEARAAGA